MSLDNRGKAKNTAWKLSDFPVQTFDKVRYADTDRQGHVNHTSFASFLETGRVEILYGRQSALTGPGASFVIATLTLDFLGEINWPGRIDIGTGVKRVGRSSVSMFQGLFQNDRLVATADTVIVQIDDTTRRSSPLREESAEALNALCVG